VTGFLHTKHHLWTTFNKIKYKTTQITLRSTYSDRLFNQQPGQLTATTR